MSNNAAPESAKRLPWFKFYPSDWQGDELLAMCSLGARGLLVGFLCLMHRAIPYGYLLVNGKQPTDAELARMVRASSLGELKRLRDELIDRGVLSRAPDGVIFSRRMVRKAEQSAIGQETGRRGGNPQLKPRPLTATVNPPPLTQPLTVGDNTQKPEAIFQKPEARNKQPESSKGGGKIWKFSSLYVSQAMHKIVTDALGPKAVGLNFDAIYEAAALHYLENGEPGDKLDDLKKRARVAAMASQELLEEQARESEWRKQQEKYAQQDREAQQRREQLAKMTPEEKAAAKAARDQQYADAMARATEKHKASDAAHALKHRGRLLSAEQRAELQAIVSDHAAREAAHREANPEAGHR